MASSQDTTLQNLIINDVDSESTLQDMVDDDQIQPNQLYATPDETEDTKAEKDASNLSSTNVQSWQTKLEVGKLVASTKTTVLTNTITINNLDINGDGGTYKIIVECKDDNSSGYLGMRVNGITSNYYSNGHWFSGANEYGYYDQSYMQIYPTTNLLHEITLVIRSNGQPVINALCSGLISGSLRHGSMFGYYNGTVSNITSVTFISGGRFDVGSEVRIYRLGAEQ